MTITKKDVELFQDSIESIVDIDKVELPEAFYYGEIALCIIDAVYSIGIRYNAVINVINNFKNHVADATPQKDVNEYYTDDLIDFYKSNMLDFEKIAVNIFNNRCRTSSRNGILKAQAVYKVAKVLQKYNLQKKSDMKLVQGDEAFENDIKEIEGQRSGVMLKYLYMLAGDENYIKPDRHVLNFIEESIGRQVTHDDAQKLIEKYIEVKRVDNPKMNCRLVDNIIWEYMRSRKASSKA